MKNEFIPYKEALALKELGYKEISMRLYVDGELSPQVDEGQFNHDWDIVSAPLFQQAFRWFREEHNLLHTVNIDLSNNLKDKVYIYTIEDQLGSIVDRSEEYNTYEEAELACLKKLIEIINQMKDE